MSKAKLYPLAVALAATSLSVHALPVEEKNPLALLLRFGVPAAVSSATYIGSNLWFDDPMTPGGLAASAAAGALVGPATSALVGASGGGLIGNLAWRPGMMAAQAGTVGSMVGAYDELYGIRPTAPPAVVTPALPFGSLGIVGGPLTPTPGYDSCYLLGCPGDPTLPFYQPPADLAPWDSAQPAPLLPGPEPWYTTDLGDDPYGDPYGDPYYDFTEMQAGMIAAELRGSDGLKSFLPESGQPLTYAMMSTQEEPAPVPIPATLPLVGLGLWLMRKRWGR